KEIKPNLGAIVEFLPRQQGLVHISQIANERVEDITKYLKVGDKVELKLIEITPDGKFRLSLKAIQSNDNGEQSAHQSHHNPSQSYHKAEKTDKKNRDKDDKLSFKKK
ncbi:MAG TPA: S1 RNA-binding domain-containing protein, partial [Bacteroidota bacterium]|nr:S1 RNA-binding domain-containing protein [Bacteroidota bacterium]